MRKYIIGFICGALIFSVSTVFADEIFKKAYVKDWGLNVCGTDITLTNKIVSIDGRSYLPVREIANSLGYEITMNYGKVEAKMFKSMMPECGYVIQHVSEVNSSSNQTNPNNPTPTATPIPAVTPIPTTTTNNKLSLINAENERHKLEIQGIEADYKKSKDFINGQKEQVRREGPVGYLSDYEYENKLATLLDEQTTIQKKINTIRLDDSYEAKAKRKELNEQLDKKAKEIADIQAARGGQLRFRALEDQLNTRTEGYQTALKQENELHRTNINAIN